MTLPIGPSDPGIRPAGAPDRCFYCGGVVGSCHSHECVMVVNCVRYEILYKGKRIGTYDTDDPVSFGRGSMEFRRNEGGWCTDNMLDEGTCNIDNEALWADAQRGNGCMCEEVWLKVLTVGAAMFLSGQNPPETTWTDAIGES